MADDAPAKVYSDQRDVTIVLGESDGFTLPFRDNWRAPDAIAGVVGTLGTLTAVTLNLYSGHAVAILIIGAALTVGSVLALAKLPQARPTMSTRLAWWWENTRPTVSCSHRQDPKKAPINDFQRFQR
ncbi:hypothetical protein [Mycobacterium sp. SMC-17]|uniref:hypothetical protein n=1 Tax=Mycobacterium sp. SMC-17 TaxID=3381628 RepID=UPI0038773010